jgi:two-component system, cell cycle sensor histidine kinase and response regulator CckA
MTETPSDDDLKKLNAEHRRQRNMTPEEECRYCTYFEMQKDAKIKGAEKALDESESKYRTLFDMVSDALALIEIDTGQMLDVNKTFLKLYGYSKEDVLRMKNTDFSAEPGKTKHITRAKGTYVPVRYHKKKDGTVFPTEISAGLFKYQGRDVHLAAIRDITERQRFEDLRQRSQKMEFMGLMAGGVAHDLNNVLSGIVSYPELLLLELPEDSKLRNPIMTMHKAGQRAAAIVEDLLTIARGVAIAKEPIRVNGLVDEYLNSPEYKKLRQCHPTVTFHTHLDSGLFNILGSYVHIRKVVMNLVSNAAEAIDGVGNVTLSTMNRYADRPINGYDDIKIDEYVVLSVSDDGLGISPDETERIFEPFFTKKVMGRSGTGLGLSVVWNVVEDHHGYIDVKSSEEGTTFEVYLPITRDAPPDKKVVSPISDYKGDNETILVVDDAESQRELFSTMLNALCYKPKVVTSGEAAVEYLKTNSVDLVLLDMIMDPGINGLETYKRIIEIHPNQKAIIVSGFAETNDVKEAQQLGAGPYIKKPFAIEKIGLAIRDELNK